MGVSSDALKAAARAFVEEEASSSSGRRGFFAVDAADGSVSLSLVGRERTKKKRREGEEDAAAADDEDDDDDRAGKVASKRARKIRKKEKRRAERAATAAGGAEDEAAAAPPPPPRPPPPPQTPAAAATKRQLRLPGPVITLASSARVPSGDSNPRAAAAASAAAAAPETLPRWRASALRPDAKTGRLSSSEREALVAAAKGFARAKGLSMEDLSWLFETRTGASKALSRGAWNAIAAALPERTAKSVYAAGTRLLHPGNYKGVWTPDEVSRMRELVAEKGNRWVEIGGALGRLPEACRDKWKELGGTGSGGSGGGGGGGGASSSPSALALPGSSSAPAFNSKRWAPDEVDRLERAVRADLATKAAAAAAAGGDGGGGGEGTSAAPSASAASLPPAGVAASVVGARAVLDGVNWLLVSSRCAFSFSSRRSFLRTSFAKHNDEGEEKLNSSFLFQKPGKTLNNTKTGASRPAPPCSAWRSGTRSSAPRCWSEGTGAEATTRGCFALCWRSSLLLRPLRPKKKLPTPRQSTGPSSLLRAAPPPRRGAAGA